MIQLTANYRVSASRMPAWILMFIARLDLAHWRVEDGDVLLTLRVISSRLDEHTYIRRNSKCSGKTIKREIVDNKLLIYSSTDKTVLVIIEAKKI
ncbi:hypothetical protein M2138_000171 [Dysgonomonadaceae bacterium PH5-43]|nr:hypothetical protein [Dysgonomonadaceae bacterium PH5-43]